MVFNFLRQVLSDLLAGNSTLAKSLSEKSNHAMYQDENQHRCLLSLQINKTSNSYWNHQSIYEIYIDFD